MLADRKPFFRQFAWVSGGRIVAAVLQALLLILVAQRTTPAQFGILAAILGLTTVVQTLLDFGVGTFISRERAASPQSGAIATALRFNRLTSLGLALLVLMGLSVAGITTDPIYFLLLPLAISASGERNADAHLAVVLADGDARVNVSNLVTRRLAAILILLVFVSLDAPPVLAFTGATALAAVGSALFANAYVSRRVVTPPTISYRELMRESWPYWLNSLATQARNLDVTVTAAIAGATQAGYYSTGSRLTSPLRILPTSLSSVLLPAASRASARSDSFRPLVAVATAVLLLMTIIYGALFILVPWGLPLVLGTQYASAVLSVQVVIAGLPFAAAASLLGSLLQGQGQKHFVATIASVTTVTCLVLIVLVAPEWGAVGAAAALSSSFVIQAVLLTTRSVTVTRRRK